MILVFSLHIIHTICSKSGVYIYLQGSDLQLSIYHLKMCLRTVITYTFCRQSPYSSIIRTCKAEGICEAVHTRRIYYEDVCPDCYFGDDPQRVIRESVDATKKFDRRLGYQIRQFEERNPKEEIDAIFERAEAFVAENFTPADRNNRFIFCSSESLNRDACNHLWRLLEMQLLPYIWLNFLARKGSSVSTRRRTLTLQMLEALSKEHQFISLYEDALDENTEREFRRLIGAHSRWVTTEVENPPDDDCAIDRMPLRDETTVRLPCGHMFHENCIEAYVDGVNCPYCRDPKARGPVPDISARETGPMPKWLYVIAPPERPRVNQELLSQLPPTDEEIDNLKNAFKLAQDDTESLFKDISDVQDELDNIRAKTIAWERNFLDDSLDSNGQSPLSEFYQSIHATRMTIRMQEIEHQELLSDANKMHHEPHVSRNYQYEELQSGLELSRFSERRRYLEDRFYDICAGVFGWDKIFSLEATMKKELLTENILSRTQMLWRLGVARRDKAADNLSFAVYHKSLHELQK